MQRWIGRWLATVGALHTLLGVVAFSTPLRASIGAGPLNVLGGGEPLRGVAFWFLFGGVFICLVGYLIDWIERTPEVALPRPVGWTLLATAVVGVAVAPVSGFWLAFPPAVGLLMRSRASGGRPPRVGDA